MVVCQRKWVALKCEQLRSIKVRIDFLAIIFGFYSINYTIYSNSIYYI